ncbi:Non-specific lipid-transfer protein-like protein [Dendrobium catenatum]|uniref:Non-specific lipid-transfer protein-like protein n=1 Tax=Dendrobium catenatum TaxID=906689 RepID=A0A2I0WE01_9ASPA|nr:Non-specific lipid-transfer protein-like protein [Dendrobium catenatum]
MALRAMMILVATAMVMAYRSIPVTAQTGCTAEIISLAPCLSYISGNSTAPSSSCCSQLSNVVRSQPLCLCTVLNGGFSIGISLNKTRALALPGACKVQTPPVSKCNGNHFLLHVSLLIRANYSVRLWDVRTFNPSAPSHPNILRSNVF